MIDASHRTDDVGPADDDQDRDPLVAEVRAVRETIARAAGYDLARIVADLQRVEAEERARGRAVVTNVASAPSPAA